MRSKSDSHRTRADDPIRPHPTKESEHGGYPSRPEMSQLPPMRERTCRVAILDDSTVVRERLVSMLSELPSVDVVAQTTLPFEAISAIRKLRPDVAILDISMPGGSGVEVLQAVKREKSAPIVIMLTNFAHDQCREQCLRLGADYFFDKSTEFDKVIAVLAAQSSFQATPQA